MIKKLNFFLSGIRIKQTISLLSINILSIPIGFIISILLARVLGAIDYGNYMFILNIFMLAVSLLTFGFFHAGNRAITLCNDKIKVKELYGSVIIIAFLIYLVSILILLFYINFDSNIDIKGLKSIFLIALPTVLGFIFFQYFEDLLQANNEIKLLSQVRIFPKIIFLIGILFIYFFLNDLKNNDKLIYIIYIQFISFVLVFVYVLVKLEISINNFNQRFLEILSFNKTYGIDVYLGSIFAVGFAQLSIILISYFGDDNSGIAYYALAIQIATPLLFIPNTIATTHFKDFSKIDKLPNNIIKTTLFLTIMSLIFSWVLIKPVVIYFFGIEFHQVINLFYIVSAGVALYGISDFYNRFLGANGQGKMLRNSSLIVGTSLLIFSLLLIPKFGEVGAALTKLFTGFFYFASIFYYYKKYKLTQKK